MQIYRITFTVENDDMIDFTVESTKGCPQCDGAHSRDDLDEGELPGDGHAAAAAAGRKGGSISSIKSVPDEADSDSRF